MNNTPELVFGDGPTPVKSGGGRKGKVKTRRQMKEASQSQLTLLAQEQTLAAIGEVGSQQEFSSSQLGD